jgi:hypothetical protein
MSDIQFSKRTSISGHQDFDSPYNLEQSRARQASVVLIVGRFPRKRTHRSVTFGLGQARSVSPDIGRLLRSSRQLGYFQRLQ